MSRFAAGVVILAKYVLVATFIAYVLWAIFVGEAAKLDVNGLLCETGSPRSGNTSGD